MLFAKAKVTREITSSHGSEAEFRNQETRIAERCVFHDALQLLSTFVDVYL
jgi:hypothetical protein